MILLQYRFLGGDHRDKVPFSSHRIKSAYYECDSTLLMLLLNTWLKQCLSAFSTVKLFCPLLPYTAYKEVSAQPI